MRVAVHMPDGEDCAEVAPGQEVSAIVGRDESPEVVFLQDPARQGYVRRSNRMTTDAKAYEQAEFAVGRSAPSGSVGRTQ